MNATSIINGLTDILLQKHYTVDPTCSDRFTYKDNVVQLQTVKITPTSSVVLLRSGSMSNTTTQTIPIDSNATIDSMREMINEII